MRSNDNQNNNYVNDGVRDLETECEYVYEQGSIDDGTYVYEEESRKPSTKDASIPRQKPGHQRGRPGVYDEIDYELDPQIQDAKRIKINETVPTYTAKEDAKSEKKKIIIGVVIGSILIGAIIVVIVFALPGWYTQTVYLI